MDSPVARVMITSLPSTKIKNPRIQEFGFQELVFNLEYRSGENLALIPM